VNAFSFVYRGLFFLTGFFFFLSSCGMYLRYSLNNKIKDSYIILNIYHEKLYIYKHIYTKLILRIYIILQNINISCIYSYNINIHTSSYIQFK
jgi:type IV secretory pathway TraG/TraD family ATPase VirD4